MAINDKKSWMNIFIEKTDSNPFEMEPELQAIEMDINLVSGSMHVEGMSRNS
jgi:hypothetical protein